MSNFIAEIRALSGQLPTGWLPCDGRELSIATHRVLHQLLGNRYGGDGHTTFALPDLRDRATAGVDHRRDQGVGASSGKGGAGASLIPYVVVNWGIATSGAYPDAS